MVNVVKKRKQSAAPRTKPFQKGHLIDFCMEISQSEINCMFVETVTSVLCLFCKRLGRFSDKDETRKRKRTGNIKFIQSPFRKDRLAKHAREQNA